VIAERPAAVACLRPVYHHAKWGPIATLDDNGPNGPKAYGAAREARLRTLHLSVIFPYEDGDLPVPDPPWLQSGNGAPVTGYDVRASKRHKGEHSDGPGIAAVPHTAPPYMATILHYENTIDRLLTTGAIARSPHLWILRARWMGGAPLLSNNGRYPASCAGILAMNDKATDRAWRTAVVTLFWELWPDGE
jgi:hypothetical protein